VGRQPACRTHFYREDSKTLPLSEKGKPSRDSGFADASLAGDDNESLVEHLGRCLYPWGPSGIFRMSWPSSTAHAALATRAKSV